MVGKIKKTLTSAQIVEIYFLKMNGMRNRDIVKKFEIAPSTLISCLQKILFYLDSPKEVGGKRNYRKAVVIIKDKILQKKQNIIPPPSIYRRSLESLKTNLFRIRADCS